jgi:hypothetical protein
MTKRKIKIYYYFYNGIKFGALNQYKIKCMSERDSDGVVHLIEVEYPALFGGVFMNEEWL